MRVTRTNEAAAPMAQIFGVQRRADRFGGWLSSLATLAERERSWALVAPGAAASSLPWRALAFLMREAMLHACAVCLQCVCGKSRVFHARDVCSAPRELAGRTFAASVTYTAREHRFDAGKLTLANPMSNSPGESFSRFHSIISSNPTVRTAPHTGLRHEALPTSARQGASTRAFVPYLCAVQYIGRIHARSRPRSLRDVASMDDTRQGNAC